MADFVVILFYLGGFGLSYRRGRAIGQGRIMATVNAIGWPYSVGWAFAMLYYDPRK